MSAPAGRQSNRRAEQRPAAPLPRISLIVPLYNEEKAVVRLQEQLHPLMDACEIIMVDGGSTDATLGLVEPCFSVLHSSKGRANQMNAGALASTGDILFFLHCDSELPPHPLEEIRRVMARYRTGCFGLSFDSSSPVMLACRVLSNHRCKYRRIVFGDQGLFIERALFFEVGMFPPLPLMEDYQLSLTLRERNIAVGLTRHRIRTSARRFPPGTRAKLRVMWNMIDLRRQYRNGVPVEDLARQYGDVR